LAGRERITTRRAEACDHRDLVAVGATAAPSRARGRSPELVAIAVVTLLAGTLRLWSLAKVPSDPFYDAAVRSMPLSLHNFLLGAYEPGGTLAIDKPPLDVWLQVLSTQLFGFGSVTLKLPPALAGTAAAAVLYDAVREGRRGRRAGPRDAADRPAERPQRHDGRRRDGAERCCTVAAGALRDGRQIALVLSRGRGNGPGLQREAV
jgi:hypothetical protein